MADVFLSYAQEDRTRARQLADALRERGWDVWWDAHVYVGTRFRAEIARQLQSAKCVVVLWSQASIESDWVIDEAEDGKTRGVLVQALIDASQPPHGFRGIQWANLNSWSGDTHAEEFVKFADGISRFAPVATPTPTAIPPALRPDPPAHTEIDSDVQSPEPEGWVLRLRLASDRLTELANRRPLVVGGAGLASVIVAIIVLSSPTTEQAPQVAQASPNATISSPPSASPSTDASPGQNGGNNSAPRTDRLPSAEAPSSPSRSPATASTTESAKPAASDGSSSSSPTATRSSRTAFNGAFGARSSKTTPTPETTPATERMKQEGSSRNSSPTTMGTSGIDLNKLFELSSPTTTSSPVTTSTTEGVKPAASGNSRGGSLTSSDWVRTPSSTTTQPQATTSATERAQPTPDGARSRSGFWTRALQNARSTTTPSPPATTPAPEEAKPSSSNSTGTPREADCPPFSWTSPSVLFGPGEVSLSVLQKSILDGVATEAKKNERSLIHATVFYLRPKEGFSFRSVAMGWAIKGYLESQGIPQDRMRIDYHAVSQGCELGFLPSSRISGEVRLEVR
jgi:hypothetical protein